MEYRFQLEQQLKERPQAIAYESIEDSKTNPNEIVITAPASSITEIASFLKNQKNFRWLMDIGAVHYPEREKNFEAVYHFFNREQNKRVRVKVPVKEGEKIPSLTPIYKAADWAEREAFDMMGLEF